MSKAAIYARYSTDLQSSRSVEDQFALCRELALKLNLDVVREDHDREMSGDNLVHRLGLQRLMAAAKRGEFQVLIAESPDRISRSVADFFQIKATLDFLGIKICPASQGGAALDTLTAGFHAIIGQVQLEDTKSKVRRGMRGRAADGLSMGGRTFGYSPLRSTTGNDADRGKLVVCDPEAEIIREIFEQYAKGRTPRQIAYSLNERAVPAPNGGHWNASTINGSRTRQNGIIQNAKYVGTAVWNRVRMVKDPATGKRLSRPQVEERVVVENAVPAIVSLDLWNRVQALREKRGQAQRTNQFTRRPKRMLSGLLKCGACGSGMSGNGKDRSGRERIRCTRHAESGTCPNPATHYLDDIESWVLEKLKGALSDPRLVQAYIEEYLAERRRLAATANADRSRLQRNRDEARRDVDRITTMLVKGIGDEHVLDKAHKDAAARLRSLESELSSIQEVPLRVEPHAALIRRYLAAAESLQSEIERGAKGDDPAMMTLREIIDRVTVSPDKSITLEGRLAEITNGLEIFKPAVWGAMVAEEGLEPPTQGL